MFLSPYLILTQPPITFAEMNNVYVIPIHCRQQRIMQHHPHNPLYYFIHATNANCHSGGSNLLSSTGRCSTSNGFHPFKTLQVVLSLAGFHFLSSGCQPHPTTLFPHLLLPLTPVILPPTSTYGWTTMPMSRAAFDSFLVDPACMLPSMKVTSPGNWLLRFCG